MINTFSNGKTYKTENVEKHDCKKCRFKAGSRICLDATEVFSCLNEGCIWSELKNGEERK